MGGGQVGDDPGIGGRAVGTGGLPGAPGGRRTRAAAGGVDGLDAGAARVDHVQPIGGDRGVTRIGVGWEAGGGSPGPGHAVVIGILHIRRSVGDADDVVGIVPGRLDVTVGPDHQALALPQPGLGNIEVHMAVAAAIAHCVTRCTLPVLGLSSSMGTDCSKPALKKLQVGVAAVRLVVR